MATERKKAAKKNAEPTCVDCGGKFTKEDAAEPCGYCGIDFHSNGKCGENHELDCDQNPDNQEAE